MEPLGTRTALPEALAVLRRDYPRELWQSHPNFSELTRFWLDRHMMFRTLIERLQTLGQGALDNELPRELFVPRAARFGGFFLNELHLHHHIEDEHYFPQLHGLEPRIEKGFELLESDHQVLDGEIDALARATNAALTAEGAAFADAAGRFLDQTNRFANFLDRHLSDEEDLIVPVILHTAPELI